MSDLPPAFRAYFGVEPGGANLRQAVADLPLQQLDRIRQALANRKSNGRLIVMGNGGSYDNARLMAACCRSRGIPAKTPGHPDDYLATALASGYSQIFLAGLEQDAVTPADIVIGLSGSGHSENILAALSFAKARGAAVFCMGGGDGGKMRTLVGEDHALIAPSTCMEAIEDLHVIMLLLVLAANDGGFSLEQARTKFLDRLASFLSDANLRALGELGDGLLGTAIHGGHAFILGTGIGANHVRADLLRGATNALPIRGLAAPECFTLNSAQATANDDGLDFLLADGLAKFSAGPRDFAILCDLLPPDAAPARAMLDHCRDMLHDAGTPACTMGHTGVLLSMFDEFSIDFAVSMVGHAASVAIRQALHAMWKVRPLEAAAKFPPGQKKLGRKDTLALESRLRAERLIEADELVTFSYGRLFAVRRPPAWTAERCYY